MKRSIVGTAVALLTFLLGVTVVMFSFRSRDVPEVNSVPQPSIKSNDVESRRLNFAEVFRDFDFVCDSTIGNECARPHGLKVSLPLPQSFEAGRRYVFHNRDAVDTDLLFEALQTRFRSYGVGTSLLPGSSITGMRLHPYGIRFQGRGYSGTVTASLHDPVFKGWKKSPSWYVNDFILTLEERPL